MNIISVGLNHETAGVDLRETLGFHADVLEQAHTVLCAANHIEEVVILSTCNRVEIYASTSDSAAGIYEIKTFLAGFHGLQLPDFDKELFALAGPEVLQHLFAVASSTKSMVLGENQIQGQIKQAFETARNAGTCGPVLGGLFQHALGVGKRVRHETSINEHSLSISNAAVRLIQQQMPNLAQKHILVLGNGKMGLLAVKSLLKAGAGRLTVLNRTEETVVELARELNIEACGFDKLADCLAQADVVISSTGAPHVIINKDLIASVVQKRAGRPLLLIDIAVPRDIEPEVDSLAGVRLYNVDQLQGTIKDNREKRTQELAKVQRIVEEEVEKSLAWLHTLEVKPVIKELRKRAESIREQELQRALRRLETRLSDSDAQLLQELTTRIVNKMLHEPISRLREQAADGNGHDYTSVLNHLFGLEGGKAAVKREYL